MIAFGFVLACAGLGPEPAAGDEEFFLPSGTIVDGGWIRGIETADLDGDGDLDVVAAGQQGVAMYENVDGLGTYGPATVVATTYDTSKVLAADLDGDGDLDVLVGGRPAWLENQDGLGHFGPLQMISLGPGTSAGSIRAPDLDGDGDLDSVWALGAWAQWNANTDGLGGFGFALSLPTVDFPISVDDQDLDADGDPDLLWASSFNDQIAWTRNGGGGALGPLKVIAAEVSHPVLALAVDLDQDGDHDVVVESDGGNTLAWFENQDHGAFGPPNVVSSVAGTPLLDAEDLDGDGDLDLLAHLQPPALTQSIAWFENGGLGAFGPPLHVVDTPNGAFAVSTGDADGDGDVDALTSRSTGTLAWHPNTDGMGGFAGERLLALGADFVQELAAADFDGDGHSDVLWASYQDDTVAWHESVGGGLFVPGQILSSSIDQPRSVVAADLDGDGDQDAVSAGTSLSWFENAGGGDLGPATIVAEGVSGTRTGDLDGDGDADLLASGELGIGWFENLDGAGTFGLAQPVASGESASMSGADIDGDGDLDALASFEGLGQIVWYENADGLGTFGSGHAVSVSAVGVGEVVAADLDGDGALDVLSALWGADKVVWYANTGGGAFAPEAVVAITPSPHRVAATDLDADGDLDAIIPLNEALSSKTGLAWRENVDGLGDFAEQHGIAPLESGGTSDIATVDLDGDGDQDVLSSGSVYSSLAQLRWHESLLTGGAISSISPNPAPAIIPTKANNMTLTGEGLLAAAGILVNGVPLDPAHDGWTIVSDTEIRFELPLLAALGPATVEVTTILTTLPGVLVEVVAPSSPVLLFAEGTAAPQFGGTVVPARVGGKPGDLALLAASLSGQPSVAPGIVELAIGDGFTSFFPLGSQVIPDKGWTQFDLPLPTTLPVIVQIHLQAAVLAQPAATLPLATSNAVTFWVVASGG